MPTTTISQSGSYKIVDEERQTNGSMKVVYTFGPATSGTVNRTVTRPVSTKRRKPAGWLYPLPYSFDKAVGQRCNGTQYSEIRHGDVSTGYVEFRSTYSGTMPASDDPTCLSAYTALPLDTSLTTLRSRAETRALLRLKDQRINLGVALGETRQLSKQIGTTATRIARAYSSLRKGQWRNAARTLGVRARSQPENWLELQYGWKPLLSDIHGAAQAVSERNKERDWVVTVASTERDKAFDGPLDYVANPRLFVYYRVRGSRGVSVSVRLDYHPSSFDYAHLPAALGLTNPLEVAWELVPYSFVVDWFLPVGNWLSTLDATLGYKFLSGSYTTRRFRQFACTVNAQKSHVASSGRYRFTGGSAAGWYAAMELRRNVYASSPIPALRPKNPVSLGHMANGLSLLTQAFAARADRKGQFARQTFGRR